MMADPPPAYWRGIPTPASSAAGRRHNREYGGANAHTGRSRPAPCGCAPPRSLPSPPHPHGCRPGRRGSPAVIPTHGHTPTLRTGVKSTVPIEPEYSKNCRVAAEQITLCIPDIAPLLGWTGSPPVPPANEAPAPAPFRRQKPSSTPPTTGRVDRVVAYVCLSRLSSPLCLMYMRTQRRIEQKKTSPLWGGFSISSAPQNRYSNTKRKYTTPNRAAIAVPPWEKSPENGDRWHTPPLPATPTTPPQR